MPRLPYFGNPKRTAGIAVTPHALEFVGADVGILDSVDNSRPQDNAYIPLYDTPEVNKYGEELSFHALTRGRSYLEIDRQEGSFSLNRSVAAAAEQLNQAARNVVDDWDKSAAIGFSTAFPDDIVDGLVGVFESSNIDIIEAVPLDLLASYAAAVTANSDTSQNPVVLSCEFTAVSGCTLSLSRVNTKTGTVTPLAYRYLRDLGVIDHHRQLAEALFSNAAQRHRRPDTAKPLTIDTIRAILSDWDGKELRSGHATMGRRGDWELRVSGDVVSNSIESYAGTAAQLAKNFISESSLGRDDIDFITLTGIGLRGEDGPYLRKHLKHEFLDTINRKGDATFSGSANSALPNYAGLFASHSRGGMQPLFLDQAQEEESEA